MFSALDSYNHLIDIDIAVQQPFNKYFVLHAIKNLSLEKVVLGFLTLHIKINVTVMIMIMICLNGIEIGKRDSH